MLNLVEFQPHTWLASLQVFFALAIGHALADFPLQGEYLATSKNRRLLERLNDPARPPEIWFSCMAAHCLIHSGFVWMITGSFIFAIAEFVLHWSLDAAKCRGWTSYNMDQAGHLVCKAGYVALAATGWSAT